MTKNRFTSEFKKALIYSFFEYAVILAPIALYVFLEANNYKHDWHFFFTSPEWSIGTIFLSTISVHTYLQKSWQKQSRNVDDVLKIYSLGSLIVIVLATLNAEWSLNFETQKLIYCRWLLFLISSTIFIIFMTNSKLIK